MPSMTASNADPALAGQPEQQPSREALASGCEREASTVQKHGAAAATSAAAVEVKAVAAARIAVAEVGDAPDTGMEQRQWCKDNSTPGRA
jgi:hypothetical protein